MAYADPGTAAYGDLIDAGDWNQLVNNQLHFAAPPMAQTKHTPATPITTTSTAFVDMDAVNLSVSITTQRGKRVYAQCSFTASNTHPYAAYFDLALDGSRAGGADGLVLLQANDGGLVTIFGYWTPIAAGLHTVRLQGKTANAAGPATVKQYYPVVLRAWE